MDRRGLSPEGQIDKFPYKFVIIITVVNFGLALCTKKQRRRD